MERTYFSIDLKSFYASVECRERGLDPMTTHLVVADASRTEKTICLAVSPSLKAYGIPGRARLFEVVQKVRAANEQRRLAAPGKRLCGSSCFAPQLAADPALAIDYIVAPPQMARYMAISAQIYQVYLRHVAPEDIHSYSIDEVFIDATRYLASFHLTPEDFVRRMIRDVMDTTGITAAAGIGPNLYLAKVAMDIEAKHIPPDENGVRVAVLDEMSYRRKLWSHRPLTDFWRVGPGYVRKLEGLGLHTMGDIARCSLGGPRDACNEESLYKAFGINAQLLIDHAWGWEPCTIADIKAYRPENTSIGSGQVLPCPYPYESTRLVVREMADQLALDLVDKGLVTRQLALNVGYDRENLDSEACRQAYKGPVTTDRYGRKVPKHAHGTINLPQYTSSGRQLMAAATELLERIADRALLVRRLDLSAVSVRTEAEAAREEEAVQLDLFTTAQEQQQSSQQAQQQRDRERRRQQTMLAIKKKYGKNAILKGMDLQKDATAQERNGQIGGHKA